MKNQNEDNLGKLKEILENCLNRLTNHFSDNEIIPHDPVAELILDLCRGNRLWQFQVNGLGSDEHRRYNKAGKLVREDGTYGRLIESRKHVFVDGVNVCNLLTAKRFDQTF